MFNRLCYQLVIETIERSFVKDAIGPRFFSCTSEDQWLHHYQDRTSHSLEENNNTVSNLGGRRHRSFFCLEARWAQKLHEIDGIWRIRGGGRASLALAA